MLRNEITEKIRRAIVDDRSRRRLMFIGLNAVLAVISFVMSLVNIFTNEYLLMISTLIFSALCLLNILLLRTKLPHTPIYICFAIEALVLLCFFFISGIPNGFSALWVCLIPSFALLIFGRKSGSMFSLIALGMMVFLFWTPLGSSLLNYGYSGTFMLRLPFLYTAIYLISLFEEYVRSETQVQLEEAEQQYHYLYRHDALTGLYNRYGFNEIIEEAFAHPRQKHIAAMIFDIDDFKRINDRYGHLAGDQVLKDVAAVPGTVLCEHSRFCRWGGEEFFVLMQCQHNPQEMAEKVRQVIDSMVVEYEGNEIRVTTSVGLCVVNDISQASIGAVITQADECLYQSKENGKNRVTSVVLG